jgi:hypothetical protein
MAEVINGVLYTNIIDLDEVTEVQESDYLILETDAGTRIIQFANFLIPIENTTFQQTIEDMQTSILSLSAEVVTLKQQLSA